MESSVVLRGVEFLKVFVEGEFSEFAKGGNCREFCKRCGILGVFQAVGGFSGILSEGGILRLCVEEVKFSGPLPLCQRGEGMELSGSLPRGDSRGLCQRGDSWGLFQRVAKGWEIIGIFAKGTHSLSFFEKG